MVRVYGKRISSIDEKPVVHVTLFIGTQVDAHWIRKNNEVYFGNKDHVKVDADSKIITYYTVTGMDIHDSQDFV